MIRSALRHRTNPIEHILGTELVLHFPAAEPPKTPLTRAQHATALKEVHFALIKGALSGGAFQNLDDDAAPLNDISRQFPGIIALPISPRQELLEGGNMAEGSVSESLDSGRHSTLSHRPKPRPWQAP